MYSKPKLDTLFVFHKQKSPSPNDEENFGVDDQDDDEGQENNEALPSEEGNAATKHEQWVCLCVCLWTDAPYSFLISCSIFGMIRVVFNYIR